MTLSLWGSKRQKMQLKNSAVQDVKTNDLLLGSAVMLASLDSQPIVDE